MERSNGNHQVKRSCFCLLLLLACISTGCTRTTYSVLHKSTPVPRNNASFVVNHSERDYLGSSPIRVRGATNAQTYNVTLHPSGFRSTRSYLWGNNVIHGFFSFSAGIIPLVETTTSSQELYGFLTFEGMPPTRDYPVMEMRLQRKSKFYWGWLFLPMGLGGVDVKNANIPANRTMLTRELRGIPEDKLNPFIP